MKRFRSHGLDEWTGLPVDRATFFPLAQILAEELLDLMVEESSMEDAVEEAELLVMISSLYGISVPSEYMNLARWCVTHSGGSSQLLAFE